MSLLDHRPDLTPSEANAHVALHYGLDGTATPLPSERDQNFLIDAGTVGRFVLKVANAAEAPDFLEAQNAVLNRLALATDLCPRVVPSLSGRLMEPVADATDADAPRYLARLVTYLEGAPLARIRRPSVRLLAEVARGLGRIDRALAGFDHPALHREFHWDLARGLPEVERRLELLEDRALRALVERLVATVARRLNLVAPRLRAGIVHADANDHNVLVEPDPLEERPPRVTGLIDFGDAVHSWLVVEPAVAIAYAVLDREDPLAIAAAMTAGYHAELPLIDDEIGVVFDLACLRLCVSACMAADQQRHRPDDEYLTVSQAAIRRTLPRLAAIPSRLAQATLRHACGLVPVPSAAPVAEWISSRRGAYAPVLEEDSRLDRRAVVDLGVTSPLVSADPAENAPGLLGARIDKVLAAAGARVGVGRYDEARLLYTAPPFAVEGSGSQWRTVHLGVDLFAAAGTPVHAPLSGTVHALGDRAGPLDYGPAVVLRHATDRGEVFYTLYGHLSRGSLATLAPGTPVAAGAPFATLGGPHENGGWPPHLHLQLIVDLLDLGLAFPGVCHASQREVWRHLSPDPGALAGLPPGRAVSEPSVLETLAERRRRLGGNLDVSYREPVKVVRGWMQYLWDESGRRHLDAYNNVPHVGHCHPRVVEAGRRQMGLVSTNTRYLHDLVNEYAARLAATLPGELGVCYFVNSASEANELALRLARAHTGARDVIVLEAAYHGHTTSLIDISPYKHAGPGGRGAPAWVHVAPLPDDYRGPYRRGEPDIGPRYAGHVRAILERLRRRSVRPMGFIAETCPSVGGQVFLPEGYLTDVYSAVRDAGGVCIADEVQTGYGRIGSHFWAFEAHGVVPDIVVMGKPIGNGHPIGAVVTTPEIARSFDNGMEFFSTFGGSTVSCAIGLAVLDVMRDEGWQAHAKRVGDGLMNRLTPLVSRRRLVGDVRGSGLFLGVELVRDRATLDPAGPEASWVVNRLREAGILLGTDGPYHNVLKIRPPMPFDEGNADHLAGELDEVLAELD